MLAWKGATCSRMQFEINNHYTIGAVFPKVRIHGSRNQVEVALFTTIPGELEEFVLANYKYGSINLKDLVPRRENLPQGSCQASY